MKVVERMIQEIYQGQNAALEDIDKRYDAVESREAIGLVRKPWLLYF